MSHYKHFQLILVMFAVATLLACSTGSNPFIGSIFGIPDNNEVVSGQTYTLYIDPWGAQSDWTDIQWISSHAGDVFSSPHSLTTAYVPSDVIIGTSTQITCTATPSGDDPQTVQAQITIVPSHDVTLTVTHPNGGENLYRNAGTNITWESSNLTGKVKIDYSSDNFVSDIVVLTAETDNTGSWAWMTISVDETTTGRIRITSVDNPTITDTSDADFNIIDAPN
jgi:hypothetical protein